MNNAEVKTYRPLFPKPLVPITTPRRPGRNQPCPCLSGLKFKRCCKDIPTLVDKVKGLIADATPESVAAANANVPVTDEVVEIPTPETEEQNEPRRN